MASLKNTAKLPFLTIWKRIANPVISVSSHKDWLKYVPERTMAGHSKWANIRHTKGAKDHARGQLTHKLTQAIRIAIREGGSADLKLNTSLANAVARANGNDVPKATIDKVLKQGKEDATNATRYLAEARGPDGTVFIFDCYTAKSKFLVSNMKNVCKRHNVKIDNQSVKFAFDYKGVIQVRVDDVNKLDADSAMDVAIETGAEDVEVVTEDSEQFIKFICDPKEIGNVKKNLEGLEYNIDYAQQQYISHSPIEVDETLLESIGSLYDKLESQFPEIENIYDNIAGGKSR